MQLAPYEITVTSYEWQTRQQQLPNKKKGGEKEEQKGWVPVLTHVFHGQTLEEAQQYARSHLLTDYFFSSSFLDKMSWKGGSVLTLRNRYDVHEHGRELAPQDTVRVLEQLQREALATHARQDQNNMLLVILASVSPSPSVPR
jgi:hypothetical protein